MINKEQLETWIRDMEYRRQLQKEICRAEFIRDCPYVRDEDRKKAQEFLNNIKEN